MAVTTLSDSLIFKGWVTEVLKNGDKNWEGGWGMRENNSLTFFPTVLYKKLHFPVYFYKSFLIH